MIGSERHMQVVHWSGSECHCFDCRHHWTAWQRPIGQVKIRQCKNCGRVQSWDDYLCAHTYDHRSES